MSDPNDQRHDLEDAVLDGPFRPIDVDEYAFVASVRCRRCRKSFSINWHFPQKVMDLVPTHLRTEALLRFGDACKRLANHDARYLDGLLREAADAKDCEARA